jgi:hypothetical protein
MNKIKLTKNKFAIVDEDDFKNLSAYKWYCHTSGSKTYARARINGELVYMHRLLLNCHEEIDHKNGNGLDNRKNNLRPCNRSENNINRINTKGYYFEKTTSKYRAMIWFNGKKIDLGRHEKEDEARSAYVEKAKELYGEFAPSF